MPITTFFVVIGPGPKLDKNYPNYQIVFYY